MQLKAGQNQYYMYIISNPERNVFELSTTGDLKSRLIKLVGKFHKESAGSIHLHSLYPILIYWEMFDDPILAITREQQVRNWSVHKKLRLIQKSNPGLVAMNEEILKENHLFIRKIE